MNNHLTAKFSCKNYPLLFGLLISSALFAQNKTSVHGKIADGKTERDPAYATVQFPMRTLAPMQTPTATSWSKPPCRWRNSALLTSAPIRNIRYEAGKHNEIIVRMTEASVTLNEIEIRPKKFGGKTIQLWTWWGRCPQDKHRQGLEFYGWSLQKAPVGYQ